VERPLVLFIELAVQGFMTGTGESRSHNGEWGNLIKSPPVSRHRRAHVALPVGAFQAASQPTSAIHSPSLPVGDASLRSPIFAERATAG
jgi:hypothetical protein